MSEPAVQAKRKRGGQKGNFNALKHGFYSRTMDKLEVGDMEAALGTDLDDLLALMKVLLRRVFDLSKEADQPEIMLSYLGGCGMAAMRIIAILKAQRMFGKSPEDSTAMAINQALTEVMKEIKLYV